MIVDKLRVEWLSSTRLVPEKELFEKTLAKRVIDFMGSFENASKYHNEHFRNHQPIGDHWDRLTRAAIVSTALEMLTPSERNLNHLAILIKPEVI